MNFSIFENSEVTKLSSSTGKYSSLKSILRDSWRVILLTTRNKGDALLNFVMSELALLFMLMFKTTLFERDSVASTATSRSFSVTSLQPSRIKILSSGDRSTKIPRPSSLIRGQYWQSRTLKL